MGENVPTRPNQGKQSATTGVACQAVHATGLLKNWKTRIMLVGAYLCYGLQSQSPIDPHLYAFVGIDCNPRV